MAGEPEWKDINEEGIEPDYTPASDSESDDPSEDPMEDPIDYHPRINFTNILNDDDLYEHQHDMELLDAVDDQEEAPGVEQIIQEMEEKEAEHEELIETLMEEARANMQVATARIVVLEKRWLDEKAKSSHLEVLLAIKEAEKIQLQADLDEEKDERCLSYWKLHKKVEGHPVADDESGYDINRSVVTSMLNKAFKDARNR